MKKSIFIAIHYMEIGGAERALLGLLSALDPNLFDVDLFVYSHQGEFMRYIPKYVNILPENPVFSFLEKPLISTVLHGHVLLAMARIWAKVADKIHNRHLKGDWGSLTDEISRATSRVFPDLHYLGEYDMAINFLSPIYVLRDKVKAKTKVSWIHTDFCAIKLNVMREYAVWASMDYIVSISSAITESFLYRFPLLKNKIIEIDNPLPTSLIKEQVCAFDARKEMPGKKVLLSIGRFCTPKNFPYAVDVMAELCKLRDDVRWYLIGYGEDESLIRRRIKELNMEEYFVILGKKLNPYPYIKACDLYVQPSLYEGKAVTVKEAQFLGKPVAITRYPSSSGQVREGIDGEILPLGDPRETAEALNHLLENSTLMDELAHNCALSDYSGKAEVQKLIDII